MSNFADNYYCKGCKEVTNHMCLDDTPIQHMYTVKCTICGRTPIRGVTYAKLLSLLEEEKQWR